MNELGSYSQYLELIAVIIGFVKYREFKNFQLKYVFYFLIYVAVNEFVAGVSYPVFGLPNYALYNVYVMINFCFFIAWYHSLLESASRKKVLKLFFFIFLIFWTFESIYLENFTREDVTLSFTLGVLFLIVAVGFYFMEMLNREVILHITQSPYFWISFGILVYCVTYLPFYLTLSIINRENPVILNVTLFLINCIQYCCFSIAFIQANRFKIEHKS